MRYRKDLSGKPWTRGRMIRFFGTSAALGILALVLFPFDQRLSDLVRLSGLTQRSLLIWQAAQPLKLLAKGDVLLMLGMLLLVLGRKQIAIASLVALLVSGMIVGPTKILVGRERPNHRDHRSFPSGDVAAVTAFLVPVVAGIQSSAPAAVASIAAIGAARVACGFHYPSDAAAGAAIGVLSGSLVFFFFPRLIARVRRFLRRSWAAVFIGFYIGLRLLHPPDSELMEFLSFFGPGFILLAIIPFFRAFSTKGARRIAGWVKGRERSVAVGIAIAIFVLFLFVTTRSTLWDRDEPRFSEATYEMIHSGDYLVPKFNGELRPDKPILIYWLMSVPMRLLGPTEIACRFFAPVGAAVSCFLTWKIGFHLIGPGAALLAMVILALTPMLLMTGTAATTDAVLLATITVAFAVIEAALRNGLKKRHMLILTLALGAALLVKGPVGLIIPLSSSIFILFLRKGLSRTWVTALVISSIAGIAIFLAWAIPANEATGGEFMRRGIGYHVMARSVRPIDSHGGNYFLFLPFYVPVLILAFYPWTLFLPAALSAVFDGRIGSSGARAFFIGWMVPTFVLMSFVSTKLPHYIQPIWPALALSAAGLVGNAEKRILTGRDLLWIRVGRWLFGVLGLGGGALMIVAPWFIPPLCLGLPGSPPTTPGLAWAIAALGIVIMVMTVFALKEHTRGRYFSTVGVLLAGMVATIFTISILALPMVERFKISKPLADAIRSRTAQNVPVVHLDYDEPSLIFYLGRRQMKPLGGDGGVVAWAKTPGPGVIVITQRALKRIEGVYGPLGLKEIASYQGFNYSKGKWVHVLALGKNLSS